MLNLRPVFRIVSKLIEKNKPPKSSVKKLIAIFAFLLLLDVVWGLISLHAWLYLSLAVAAVYTFAGLKSLSKKRRKDEKF